jgi:hypothetical protein
VRKPCQSLNTWRQRQFGELRRMQRKRTDAGRWSTAFPMQVDPEPTTGSPTEGVNTPFVLRGGAVNARRPRGTRGRSHSSARSCRALVTRRAFDGAEDSGSIERVMAGRA